MCHASVFKRIMLLMIGFNFGTALKRSGSWA